MKYYLGSLKKLPATREPTAMIYVHPTATRELMDIIALQSATGLKAEFGNRFMRLVPRTEHDPKPSQHTKPTPFQRFLLNGPGPGGDAA